eukprot:7593975-Karenia_brevis.AAC.1
MVEERISKLRTAQRKMLRKMVRVAPISGADVADTSSSGSCDTSSGDESHGHQRGETIAEYMQRATSIAENVAQKSGVSDWVTEQRMRYFGLAGHMARRTDGRWAKKAMLWQPINGSRLQGHPLKRWLDDVVQFCKKEAPQENWIYVAANRDRWSELAKKYASQA